MTKNKVSVGQKFYWLTIVGEGEPVYYGSRWRKRLKCECECGNTVVDVAANIKKGQRKSCGCKNYQVPHGNQKNDPQKTSLNALFRRHKNRSNKRMIENELTFEEFSELVFKNCHYCQIEPTADYNGFITKTGNFFSKHLTPHSLGAGIKYNGIDRINSSIGYKKDNVVPSCEQCNLAKSTRSVEDFYKWVDKLIAFQESKGMRF